ncbi:MAG: hypothetical protein RL481_558, partial [Pseudomonadota bacterium]
MAIARIGLDRKLLIMAWAMVALWSGQTAAEVPKMGPYHAEMSFAEMRALDPARRWNDRSFYDYDVVFTRLNETNDPLIWLGKDFYLGFARTGYPTTNLLAAVDLPAKNAGQCLDQLKQLAVALDAELGSAPEEWNDAPPPHFGRAGSLLEGYDYLGPVRDRYRSVVNNMPAPLKTVQTKNGIALYQYRLSQPGEADENGWRSFRMIGRQLVRLMASYGPGSYHDTSDQCYVSISFRTSGNEAGDGRWLDPLVSPLRLSDQIGRYTLAAQYAMPLAAEWAAAAPTAGVSYYLCDIHLIERRLRHCRPEGAAITGETRTYDPYARFLETLGGIPVDMEETDFRPRTARIATEPLVPPTDRAFDWSLASVSASVAGVQGLQTQRLWGDYLQRFAPNRMEEEAAVTMRCLVMPDYSVFCGDHLVEPVAATPRYRRMADEFRRRAAYMTVKSMLASGEDSAGT